MYSEIIENEKTNLTAVFSSNIDELTK